MIDRLINLGGLLLIPILIPIVIGWNSRRERKQREQIESAAKKAHDEGETSARGEQQRAATKAEHERLDQLERRILRLEADREWLLYKRALIPTGSQAGDEGRGVRNPLLDRED